MNGAEQDAVTAQLFRYAQDLDQLMQQHKRLQQHHQMTLQSLGREVPGENLLPQLLARAASMHWTTDLEGEVLHCGPQNPSPWALCAAAQPGQNLLLLVPAPQQMRLRLLLAHFASAGSKACAVRLRLSLQVQAGSPAEQVFDALLMPLNQEGHHQVSWILQSGGTDCVDTAACLADLLRAVPAEQGAMAANPQGSICAVSPGYCRMTGYSAQELLGNNPRMLSSGRHDAGFYHGLWFELLDSGSWSGTLFNRRKDGQIFLQWQAIRMVEDLDGKVLCYLSATVDLSYTDPSVKRLETIAYTDPLTGLPNRRLLTDRLTLALGEAHRVGESLALLFIDLDRFKPINDELGHNVGDQVLQAVARRLREGLLPDDLLARLGGDEFVVVLYGQQRVQMAEAIAAQLLSVLKAPLHIQNCAMTLSASIGCARFPQDAEDMLSLLQCADAAMYGAKRFGIPFCYFDVGMDDAGRPNLELELWQAVERGEISLVYQPQVNSDATHTLRGVEALMRWNHPILGDVDPIQFIGMAERSGAIVPLGYWALYHACAQLRSWREQALPAFTLSLNISLRQLRHPDFFEQVQQALALNQLQAGQLEMELSETQAMLFVQSDTHHVRTLRQLGVRIAIDDYGISFSSLSRLNLLSISSFKLNQQCVQDLTNSADARAISNCMISIGKAMGIEVIAQGVETAAQAQLLKQQGCQVLQGFYTGAPLSAEALADMLKAG